MDVLERGLKSVVRWVFRVFRVPGPVRIRMHTLARSLFGARLGLSGALPVLDPSAAGRQIFDPRAGREVNSIDFRCNVCGTHNASWPLAALDRDVPSCRGCGSSVRMRSVVWLLSKALHGKALALPEWPVRKDLRGLGLSDWSGYARWLVVKTDYTNTFFHTSPRLDICAPDPAYKGSADYLISTEVFEHVPPPAQRAFDGAADVLKAGGVLVFTTPFSNETETKEHFPFLHDFEIVERDGRHVLLNWRADGEREEFSDLVFHGGPGTTLEMRLFSRAALLRHLEAAGFGEVEVFDAPVLEFGIVHWYPWSLPILATKRRT